MQGVHQDAIRGHHPMGSKDVIRGNRAGIVHAVMFRVEIVRVAILRVVPVKLALSRSGPKRSRARIVLVAAFQANLVKRVGGRTGRKGHQVRIALAVHQGVLTKPTGNKADKWRLRTWTVHVAAESFAKRVGGRADRKRRRVRAANAAAHRANPAQQEEQPNRKCRHAEAANLVKQEGSQRVPPRTLLP
jgi:hypothetical protein